MPEELKQAAQAALDQLEFLNACYPHKTATDAADALRRALTQSPAAQTEREAFENWLGIKPCGAAHDLAWDAWKARASLPTTQQATPEPLIVKGAMAGMVDAQVRDLWPTKGATPEPVGEPVAWRYKIPTHGGGTAWTHTRPQPECLLEAQPLYARPAPGVPDGFTLDQIADACVQAEISDSRFESLSIALAAAQAKGGE